MDKWEMFFGWVGVAALVLVIPLNIASNVLTPKVQSWWARTAQKRALNRLRTIGETLSRLDNYDAHPIDPVAILVKGIANSVLGIASLVIGVLGLFMLSIPDPTLDTSSKRIYTTVSYIMIVIGILACRWAFGTFTVNTDEVTNKGRQSKRKHLLEEVKRLFQLYPQLESVDKLLTLSLITRK